MLVFIEAIVFALFIGIVASILGIGGGVFLVPTLNLILGLNMHKAIGTSLFVIFFLTLSASLSYFRRKRNLVLWKLALVFESGSVPGAYLGAHLSNTLPSSWLKIGFSMVLLYTAFRMWRGAEKGRSGENESKQSINMKQIDLKDPRYIILLIGLGLIAGLLSGLLGIGGGVVKVPIMKLILGLPMHNAVATSAFMIVITSFMGSSTHFIMGNVDYLLGLTLIPFVMLGSNIGTRIAMRLKGATISRFFAVLLAFVAIRMILSI